MKGQEWGIAGGKATYAEVIVCRGHRNVTARHPTTFEITTDNQLTPKGDCIIGIAAKKDLLGFSPGFRALLSRDDAELVTLLSCDGLEVTVKSSGSSSMSLDHPSDLVWRKSGYVCGRTVGIRSDTAACDLPREMVVRLREGKDLSVTMTVIAPAR